VPRALKRRSTAASRRGSTGGAAAIGSAPGADAPALAALRADAAKGARAGAPAPAHPASAPSTSATDGRCVEQARSTRFQRGSARAVEQRGRRGDLRGFRVRRSRFAALQRCRSDCARIIQLVYRVRGPTAIATARHLERTRRRRGRPRRALDGDFMR
jgi:hypothetical protein